LRQTPDPIRHPGNQGLFRALELSVLSTLVGLPLHVHAEGLRGTGKTTIVRSLRGCLPKIERVKGCIYNCRPSRPHCPRHRGLSADEIREIGTEWIPMPFREISHSAKIGTVAGSIDLSRIVDSNHPEAALLPGTIAQAHRGIIFVDEVNRLADTAPELADILLDVMGTKPGRLQIEETGLPTVDLEASVSVWAASNPDEDPGPLEDIRKQLSDRFDFVITMERPSAVPTVRQILRASCERLSSLTATAPACAGGAPSGNSSPEEAVIDGRATGAVSCPAGEEWSRLGEAAGSVRVPDSVEELVASLYVDFGVESLRGIEAILHGARMNCCLEGRRAVTIGDVTAVAPGALHHRLDVSTFARLMDYLSERSRPDPEDDEAGAECQAGGADGADHETHGDADGEAARVWPGNATCPATTGPRVEGAEASGTISRTSPQGGDERAPGGWSLLRSLFGGGRPDDHGRKARAPSTDGTSAATSAFSSTGAGTRPAAGASGGADGGTPGGTTRAEADETPVAPPNRARPLADILREMSAGGLTGPGSPRPH